MISERARNRIGSAALATALGFGAACSSASGVHDLSVASDPLVVVHARVDLGALERKHPEAPLLGALLWAGIPTIDPLCLKFSAPAIAPACPDPYGFFYGAIERAAPVDASGGFDLPLFHLPKASVSVGDEVTRVAYGTLLVVEDVNRDGQLSLPASLGRRDVQTSNPAPAPDAEVDSIVAASFASLRGDQLRVVFREGGFVADSNFYPMPGCAAPPPGFSLMTVPPYTAAPTDATTPTPPPSVITCPASPLDTPVVVAPLPRLEGTALLCRGLQRGFRTQEPLPDRPPPSDAVTVCLSHEVLVQIPQQVTCPRLVSYVLKGCREDPFCKTPDWDRSLSPPRWWPCP